MLRRTLILLAVLLVAAGCSPMGPPDTGPGATLPLAPQNPPGPVVVNPSGPLLPAETKVTTWGTFTQNVSLVLAMNEVPQASLHTRDTLRGAITATLPGFTTYSIIIGVPGPYCGSHAIGTVGHLKVVLPPGGTILQGLTLADATGWLVDACYIDAAKITLPGGSTARYALPVKAGLPGEFGIRTFLELAGADHTADAFRDGFDARVEVR